MLHSMLTSTNNTRFLPTEEKKYIRSDVPLGLSAQEIDFLRLQRVKTVVDLRSAREIQTLPCALEACSCFDYLPIPVTGGKMLSDNAGRMAECYMEMVNGDLLQILQTLESAGETALFFCHSGMDRTGVVSVILLMRLKIPDEVIQRDYLLSWEQLAKNSSEYLFRKRVIELFLPMVREKCGQFLK